MATASGTRKNFPLFNKLDRSVCPFGVDTERDMLDALSLDGRKRLTLDDVRMHWLSLGHMTSRFQDTFTSIPCDIALAVPRAHVCCHRASATSPPSAQYMFATSPLNRTSSSP